MLEVIQAALFVMQQFQKIASAYQQGMGWIKYGSSVEWNTMQLGKVRTLPSTDQVSSLG